MKNTVQITFHVVLCLLYMYTETFVILPAFYFKSFQNANECFATRQPEKMTT